MIDILLATHNGERYIAELLSSIKAQSYTDWRLVVSDDNSTDATQRLVEDFAKQVANEVEILSIRQSFGNAKDNFFNLLQYAKSDYVMFCDQDDVWIDNKIECSLNQMKIMEREYGIDCPILVTSDLYVVDENLNIISNSFYEFTGLKKEFGSAQLMCQNKFPGCAMMLNRALYNIARIVTDTEQIIMHDSWVGLCAAVLGRVACIDRSLILYRQHAHNTVGVVKASNPKHLLNRLVNVEQIRKENMGKVCEAKKFVETFEEKMANNNKREVIYAFANLATMGRMQYRKVCAKYGIIKRPWYRSVIQFICCHR